MREASEPVMGLPALEFGLVFALGLELEDIFEVLIGVWEVVLGLIMS